MIQRSLSLYEVRHVFLKYSPVAKLLQHSVLPASQIPLNFPQMPYTRDTMAEPHVAITISEP